MSKKKSVDKRRLVVLSALLALFFSLLIAQFFKIQIIEGEKWAQIASQQHQTIIKEPFMRGTIYSNPTLKQGHPEKPQVLALDVPKFHLYINPDAIPKKWKPDFAKRLLLSTTLLQGKEDFVTKEVDRKSKSRRLIPFLDPIDKEALFAWWKKYYKEKKIASNALYFVPDYKRSHPFKALLGQVLHTVRDEKDPNSWQGFPTGGIELSLNQFLQGRQGKRISFRSPNNRLEMGPVLEKAQNGADVYLTINHYIQAIAERALEEGVKKHQAKGGWAIMMHPSTGEIYALAQYPFFSPDDYRKFYNDPDLLEDTKVRAVTDLFEPGSIMKPMIMAVALQASLECQQEKKQPLFTPQEMIATHLGNIKGSSFRLKDMRRHKYLNMYMALQKSSNIYVGKVLERVLEEKGDEWYRNKLIEVFSFGKKTNIELPGEANGLVPRQGLYHPNGRPEWSRPTPYVIGLGHNILLNSMQIIRSFATVINGGFEVEPTIIKTIINSSIEEKYQRAKHKKKQVLDSWVSQEIIKALKYVTKPGGSGRRADIVGYTEGGKTGTSEKIVDGKYSKKKYISSFIGFAPAQDPCFVLLVVIDEPVAKYIPGIGRNNQGGACAAPIFKEIAQKALQYLGTPPDDPLSLKRDHRHKDWVWEVNQLKQLYDQWNR